MLNDFIVSYDPCSAFQIRSDTALCLYRTMPEIQEKCKEIQVIFAKIDKLEVIYNVDILIYINGVLRMGISFLIYG